MMMMQTIRPVIAMMTMMRKLTHIQYCTLYENEILVSIILSNIYSDDDDNDMTNSDDDQNVEEWLAGSSDSEVNVFEMESVNDGSNSDLSLSWSTDDENNDD